MTARASSHGNGAASLWSFVSSAMTSGGSTSLRLAIIWPIFTYVGPSCWSSMRSRSAPVPSARRSSSRSTRVVNQRRTPAIGVFCSADSRATE